jgi:hypothetical protein
VVESLLVHVTVVPALIGRVPGAKLKLTMLTVLPEAVVPVVVPVVFDVEQLIKPINNVSARVKIIISTMFFFMFSPRFKFLDCYSRLIIYVKIEP